MKYLVWCDLPLQCIYHKLCENSRALFTRDFSIINEPYVHCSLQLTKHIITHSTGSAQGLNGLFVFSTFLSVFALCAFATFTMCSGAHKISPRLFQYQETVLMSLTPNCLQCISIYYVFSSSLRNSIARLIHQISG